MTAPFPAPTVLRLHRTALIVWGVAVLAAAAALLWAYGPGGTAAEAEWRRNCSGASCMWDTSLNGYYRAFTLAELAIVWMPNLVAAWAGAALVGRELETGTAHLAWTQGVTPTRWLATKLAVPAVLLTIGTTVLVLLHRLVFETNVFPLDWYWHDEDIFLANGTIALALPLLALVLGALAGLLLRRALPALAAAFLATWLVRFAATKVTPHLWPWETAVGTLRTGYPDVGDVIHGDRGLLTSTGARVDDPPCFEDTKCLAAHDATGYFTDYHPSSHFWPLQLIETGIILGVAAAAVTVAFRLLRRRTA